MIITIVHTYYLRTWSCAFCAFHAPRVIRRERAEIERFHASIRQCHFYYRIDLKLTSLASRFLPLTKSHGDSVALSRRHYPWLLPLTRAPPTLPFEPFLFSFLSRPLGFMPRRPRSVSPSPVRRLPPGRRPLTSNDVEIMGADHQGGGAGRSLGSSGQGLRAFFEARGLRPRSQDMLPPDTGGSSSSAFFQPRGQGTQVSFLLGARDDEGSNTTSSLSSTP